MESQTLPFRSAARTKLPTWQKPLLVFRQAIADVTVARQDDARRAEDSEIRRRQVEVATRNFEGAVNDIIHALDSAIEVHGWLCADHGRGGQS